MNNKRKDDVAQTLMQPGSPELEHCHCLQLSSLQAVPLQDQGEVAIDHNNVTPASPELNALIRAKLEHSFPRSTPLGLLLLHVSQLEHITIHPQSALLHKRQRLHASASFLEQVLANVRRAIRDCDEILIHNGTGAAIIFPEVDQQGMSTILERVSRNVDLLQAETVIPPLRRETNIVLGIGSYPECGPSVEHLFYHVSVTAHRFTLRPAISAQLLGILSTTREGVGAPFADNQEDQPHLLKLMQAQGTIPFMQLPVQLPTRLKQLIPYHAARELRCVPVGRDHHCLTVAMADSTDSKALHALRKITGLTIFPVSCDVAALNALLADKW
jgi:Type II secretion system (T2SS), protein E, N-terminal domain